MANGPIYTLLAKIMAGDEAPEALGPHWGRTLSFPVYLLAVKVLEAHRPARAPMMDDMPPRIGDLVRAEVIRQHAIRRNAPPPKVQAEPRRVVNEWENWA